MAGEALKATADDPGVPQYDWFFNQDESKCVVRETYADSDAVLTHLGLIGDLLGRIIELGGGVQIEVFGSPSTRSSRQPRRFNPRSTRTSKASSTRAPLCTGWPCVRLFRDRARSAARHRMRTRAAHLSTRQHSRSASPSTSTGAAGRPQAPGGRRHRPSTVRRPATLGSAGLPANSDTMALSGAAQLSD